MQDAVGEEALDVAAETHGEMVPYPARLHLVGTLQDRYVRNVPLPRVPREQRASPALTAPKAGIQLPGYSLLPAWIPTLPKIGNVFGFSQRLL